MPEEFAAGYATDARGLRESRHRCTTERPDPSAIFLETTNEGSDFARETRSHFFALRLRAARGPGAARRSVMRGAASSLPRRSLLQHLLELRHPRLGLVPSLVLAGACFHSIHAALGEHQQLESTIIAPEQTTIDPIGPQRNRLGRHNSRAYPPQLGISSAAELEVHLRTARYGGQSSHGLPTVAHAFVGTCERRLVRKRGFEPRPDCSD
jgi:hypothetical protein